MEFFKIQHCYPSLLCLKIIHRGLQGSAARCFSSEALQVVFRAVISLLLFPVSICFICANFFFIFPVVGLIYYVIYAYEGLAVVCSEILSGKIPILGIMPLLVLSIFIGGAVLIVIGVGIFCVSFIKAIMYTMRYHLIFSSDQDDNFIIDAAFQDLQWANGFMLL